MDWIYQIMFTCWILLKYNLFEYLQSAFSLICHWHIQESLFQTYPNSLLEMQFKTLYFSLPFTVPGQCSLDIGQSMSMMSIMSIGSIMSIMLWIRKTVAAARMVLLEADWTLLEVDWRNLIQARKGDAAPGFASWSRFSLVLRFLLFIVSEVSCFLRNY